MGGITSLHFQNTKISQIYFRSTVSTMKLSKPFEINIKRKCRQDRIDTMFSLQYIIKNRSKKNIRKAYSHHTEQK